MCVSEYDDFQKLSWAHCNSSWAGLQRSDMYRLAMVSLYLLLSFLSFSFFLDVFRNTPCKDSLECPFVNDPPSVCVCVCNGEGGTRGNTPHTMLVPFVASRLILDLVLLVTLEIDQPG